MLARFAAYQAANTDRRTTVTQFAEALGVEQGTVSHWLRGNRVPGDKVLRQLAANPIIGPEAWEAANRIPELSPALRLILRFVGPLPEDEQERIASQIEQLVRDDPQSERNPGSLQAA